ncbi:hypothetical protein VTP01DRAFT_1650 [Rhizomucor pusillus]|uniref:uncharacterized protein n=1 Tax=Rhizomucor pusillus TaxID=4840 RepID=UPI0037426144
MSILPRTYGEFEESLDSGTLHALLRYKNRCVVRIARLSQFVHYYKQHILQFLSEKIQDQLEPELALQTGNDSLGEGFGMVEHESSSASIQNVGIHPKRCPRSFAIEQHDVSMLEPLHKYMADRVKGVKVEIPNVAINSIGGYQPFLYRYCQALLEKPKLTRLQWSYLHIALSGILNTVSVDEGERP